MTMRLRREPPRFRRVGVQRVESVTPRLMRVTLGGDDLDGMDVPGVAASVRLLLSDETPAWNGNEFLLGDGSRPVIRTLTPLRFSADSRTLDVEIVIHEGGALSEWATSVSPGAEVALSGPGRGYAIDEHAPAFLLAGDETALPAIGQLLESLPRDANVDVHVEIADAEARVPSFESAITWHDLPDGAAPGDALVDAVASASASLVDGARVWVAGEAAAVQRVRKHLFEERGLTRSQATVRGYWKHGRAGNAGDDDD